MMKLLRMLPDKIKAILNSIFYKIIEQLPLKAKISILYYKSHGRLPDLSNPRKYTEKIQARKLSERDFSRFVDKVLVKDFVRNRCGEQLIIPTLYSGERLPSREQRNWKIPYVIKTNHASGTNIFVTDEPDWPEIEKTVEQFLSHSLGRASGELFYDKINKQVLVEPMVGDGKDLPIDYKFFVFNGVVEHIQVDTNRHGNHCRSLYSPDWNKLAIVHERSNHVDVKRPDTLNEMILTAQSLGAGMGFVRIDLYENNNTVLFGELTFTPGSGFTCFTPSAYDEYLGSKWIWPEDNFELIH